jgi:hypothetical protein
MSVPVATEIRWRAWAAGVLGLRTRLLDDGSIELRYADEVALARTVEQADAYLRFWQAAQAMRSAGCSGPPRKVDEQGNDPAFRLQLTRAPAARRQLRLFSSTG